MCKMFEEDFDHIISCDAYGNKTLDIDYREIFDKDVSHQITIAKEVKSRHCMRTLKLEEDGLPHILAPKLLIL